MKKLISTGSTFEDKAAYSRAIAVDNMVFVSGTTGFDYGSMTISDDIIEQCEQCFKNIQWALQQADSKLDDVVRVTYILPDAGEFEKCWPVLRSYFGNIKPAATMFEGRLADPRILIEIEVTAIKSL